MTKNEPLDMKLYNDIKDRVWKMYDKPSAYRSGMLVKLYREAGGKYSGDKDEKGWIGEMVSGKVVKPTGRSWLQAHQRHLQTHT